MDRGAMMTRSVPPSSTIVLTIEEMQAVARPHTEPADITRWFRENGFTFKTAPDGYPVVLRQHFEEAMGSYGRHVRRSFKNTDLSGKDYLSRKEAAHYCCVSESQFERLAETYGLVGLPFMGKRIYRRVDCQHAIERGWEQWAPREKRSRLRSRTSVRSVVGERISQIISEARRKNEMRAKGLLPPQKQKPEKA